MQMWNDARISRKLASVFGIQISATLIVSLFLLYTLSSLQQAAFWNEHTFRVLAKIESTVTNMVNQETGLRGYLVAGQDKFLEPYRSGETAADEAVADLQILTADNPAQQERINELRRRMTQWRDDAAKPSIKLMTDPATQQQARDREASGAGKQAMDAIRAKAAEMSTVEAALLAQRTAQFDTMQSVARWALILGGLAGIVTAVVMGHLFARSVTSPIAQITAAMGRIMRGDLDATIMRTARTDEVGDLARTATAFGDAARQLRTEAAASVGRDVLERERQEREATQAREAADDQHIITQLGDGLRALADGDLTHRIETPFAAKAVQLREDFNDAATKLMKALVTVSSNTAAIRSGSREISVAADDLSKRTEQQAASLEETAAALDQITATVKKTSEGAVRAREVVSTAKADAERSGQVVAQAMQAMTAIETSSHQVSQIIGVIDEIAFQTNLLALNAGVEAARAGEAGRGFAVVASEVRALAQRSAEAAKEIKGLISTSTGQVSQGVTLVAETGKSLERIATQVTEINAVMSDMASSAQEQATGLDQVNTAINQMDQVTQQNASMVEQSTAASHSLAQEAEELSQLMQRFRIGTDAGSSGRVTQARGSARSSRAPVPAPAPAPSMKTMGRGGAARKAEPQVEETSWEEF